MEGARGFTLKVEPVTAEVPVTDRKVIPFRKRPPGVAELAMYRQITRNWHPEMRRAVLPEHFVRDALTKHK